MILRDVITCNARCGAQFKYPGEYAAHLHEEHESTPSVALKHAWELFGVTKDVA